MTGLRGFGTGCDRGDELKSEKNGDLSNRGYPRRRAGEPVCDGFIDWRTRQVDC